MASQFYKRYIPPPVKVVEEIGERRPSKKRKRTTTASSTPGKLPQNGQRHGQSTLSQAVEEREADEDSLPVRCKHPAIFARYDSAAKHSEENARVSSPQDEPMAGQEDVQKLESHGLEPLPQPAQAAQPPKVSAFSALPHWLQSPISVSSTATVPFSTLPINESTISVLREKGYATAFAIQSSLLPMLLPGPQHYAGDLCVSAATGSGKTLAYVLPMVESFRDKPVRRMRGLIVVPTRELVNQVKETVELCSAGSGVAVGTAVGSRSLKEETAMLVHKGQKYNTEGYRAEQDKEIDEDEELMDWDFDKRFGPKDDFELYYNHVVEYTSNVDILVCTPGRLVEHVQSTTGFTLQHIQWLVVDEADRLLDESFQQWVDIVSLGLEYLPPLDPIAERLANTFHLLRRREVRKVILSATMTRDISKLTSLKLRRPRLVVLEGQQPQKNPGNGGDGSITEARDGVQLPATLHEVGVKVPDINDKPLYLIRLLLDMEGDLSAGKPDTNGNKGNEGSDGEDSLPEDSDTSMDSEHGSPAPTGSTTHKNATPEGPTTRPSTHGTLIFTKTNEHATRLARLISLIRPEWKPKTLTKSSASSAGRKTLTLIRKQKISILIASDRASRGLDIPDLAHVINYDMPSSIESYIHRVGRTARAGKEGKATTLIADNEARWFWNEIARSKKVGRGPGRKVNRDNTKYEFGDKERERYAEALMLLGQEARGGQKRPGKDP